MRILILEHEPDVAAGLLGAWSYLRGHELEVARVPGLRRWPSPSQFDAIVSLGSEASVHGSRNGWVPRELDFLAAAHAAGTSMLGICFGGQALAKALGGEVRPVGRPEVGWRCIDTDRPGLIPPGPWFRWHFDRFIPPAGARRLAGADGEADAFALGAAVGIQFHPEVDAEIVEHWITDGEEKLIRLGVDVERIQGEVAQRAPEAHDRAFDFFDRLAAWWSGAAKHE